jgi:hypothetical protein
LQRLRLVPRRALVRAGDRLRLGATITFEFGPYAGEREWRAIIMEREPDNVLLFGLAVRLRRVLREAIRRTRHRFSGLSQPRQCGDEVLRIFVTGGPPVRGGGGIPQRIRTPDA